VTAESTRPIVRPAASLNLDSVDTNYSSVNARSDLNKRTHPLYFIGTGILVTVAIWRLCDFYGAPRSLTAVPGNPPITAKVGDEPQAVQKMRDTGSGISEGLFHDPHMGAVPPVIPIVRPVVVSIGQAVPPILQDDHIGDYVYSGSTTIDGKLYALIEDKKSHEGWYVGEGQEWRGMQIRGVSTDQVTIGGAGGTHSLAKSDAFSTTPLLAAAPGYDRNVNSTGLAEQLLTNRSDAVELSFVDGAKVQFLSDDIVTSGVETFKADLLLDSNRVGSTEYTNKIFYDAELGTAKRSIRL